MSGQALVAVALALVFVILLSGLYALLKGGEASKKPVQPSYALPGLGSIRASLDHWACPLSRRRLTRRHSWRRKDLSRTQIRCS